MSDSYDLHASLGYQATLFARIAERRFEKELAPLGLTRVTWCVLLAVGQEGHKNPTDIANFVGVDRTATSRALRKLEADGLITRTGGQGDKRTTKVSITEIGSNRLEFATVAASKNAEHFTKKLSWYERDTFATIIKKLMEDEIRNVPGL